MEAVVSVLVSSISSGKGQKIIFSFLKINFLCPVHGAMLRKQNDIATLSSQHVVCPSSIQCYRVTVEDSVTFGGTDISPPGPKSPRSEAP